MSQSIALFVSERLQPPIAAFLCLAFIQLACSVLTSCQAEPLPMGAVRVAISH
jgi:hypothetical protein